LLCGLMRLGSKTEWYLLWDVVCGVWRVSKKHQMGKRKHKGVSRSLNRSVNRVVHLYF